MWRARAVEARGVHAIVMTIGLSDRLDDSRRPLAVVMPRLAKL
jgi:hypothetical protein